MHVETVFPNPLTTPEWLGQNLNQARIVVLDATFFLPNQGREAAREFETAHIPGARFFDIDAVADHSSPLPHMLPPEQEFVAAAGRLGIDNQTQVVVYDNNSFMASARAWWTFRIFGHDRVVILDGGLARWVAEGRPVEAGPASAAEPREFETTFHPALVRSLEDVRELATTGAVQIVDARSPGRFAGTEPEPRPGLRSGHIPGSRNLFFKRLVDERTGCLKAGPELEREFLAAGVDPQRPVMATCGTGVTAAVLALGLYRLGNEFAAVYDGSWTEWGGRADTPVEEGETAWP
jgi:thiosulfate/3-mercaptopyruvate sulfurtransferase